MATGTITLTPHTLVSISPLPRSQETPPAGWSWTLVPNFSDWELGDIVLVEAQGPTGKLVVAAQKLISPTAHLGRWSHCGIYSGDGKLIEAIPGSGVVERSISLYCGTRALAVVRMAPDANTPKNAGALAAAHARARIGDSYAWGELSLMVRNWLANRPTPMASNVQGAAYCSALIVQSYGKAPVNTAFDTAPNHCPCLPANLAVHPWLEDVQIHWCRP